MILNPVLQGKNRMYLDIGNRKFTNDLLTFSDKQSMFTPELDLLQGLDELYLGFTYQGVKG